MNTKAVNYVVALLGLLGVLYAAADKWFELQYRVKRLEEGQRYIHGNVDSFLPKEP